MEFWGELVKEVIEGAKEGLEKGLKEGAKEVKEALEYHVSYKELVREVESENPNPEQVLKSANTFLPLADKVFEKKI